MKKRNKTIHIFSVPWKALCVALYDTIATRSSKTLKKVISMKITFYHHIVSRSNSICHYSDLELLCYFLLDFIQASMEFCFWLLFWIMPFHTLPQLQIISLYISIVDNILTLHRLYQTKMKVMHSYFVQDSLHLPLKR